MAREKSTIKKLADQRGIKYSWLARQIGLHPTYFAHVEAGDYPAPPGYFEKVAGALGVPIEWVKPDPEPESEQVPA